MNIAPQPDPYAARAPQRYDPLPTIDTRQAKAMLMADTFKVDSTRPVTDLSTGTPVEAVEILYHTTRHNTQGRIRIAKVDLADLDAVRDRIATDAARLEALQEL